MSVVFSRLFDKISKYKSDIIYTTSNVFVQFSGFVSSIVAVAYISPENMGIYQSVLLLLFYMNFLHLGVFQGLNRNISFHSAKNQANVVQEQVNTSYSVAVVVSAIGGFVGLLLLIHEFLHERNTFFLLAIILLVLNLLLIPFKTHFEATFRSSSQFGLLGKIIYKENLVFLVTSFLPIIIGYYGKITSDCIKIIYSFYLRSKNITLKATGAGNKDQLYDLLKIGFPILISTYLWSLFLIADQTFISYTFPKVELGYYTLSKLITTSTMIIPNATNALLYPKMSRAYAETNRISCLRVYVKKTLMINTIILAPFLVISYIFIDDLVLNLFPRYSPGIPAAKVSIISCMTFILMSPAVVFGIINKNKMYLIFLILMLSFFWLIINLFSEMFDTILIVAEFKLISLLILSGIVLSYSIYITK